MVRNQLARRSYGVLCVMKHNGTGGTKGQRKHVFVDPMTGELKIDNRVSWFIKKVSTTAITSSRDETKSYPTG
jgi:hypothetical protein